MRAALAGPGPGDSGLGAGGLWTSLEVVAVTGSTNADLLRRGGAEGQVLVAESQVAGRGRMGRSWVSAPGASLTFSVLLRPVSVPAARRGWLPLLTGVAVASAVRDVSGVAAVLKWPNDVLAGSRKLAGILAEQSGDAVVIGIGLNVATPADALPVSPSGLPATSLLVEGASVSREALLAGILRELERRYTAFRDDPDPARRPAVRLPRFVRDPRPLSPGRAAWRPRPVRRGGRHRRGRAAAGGARPAARPRPRSRPAMSSTSGELGA